MPIDLKKLFYQADKKRLLYKSGVSGKTLLNKTLGLALSAVAKQQRHDEREVRSVVVGFDDERAAHYNADALKFLGLGTEVRGRKVESKAKFTVREDFGIDQDKWIDDGG